MSISRYQHRRKSGRAVPVSPDHYHGPDTPRARFRVVDLDRPPDDRAPLPEPEPEPEEQPSGVDLRGASDEPA